MASPAETGVRRGRRQGEPVSRAAVLAAARQHFAASGYEKTTLRAVARDAGVDPSMVLYLFGSKEGLFRAAMQLIVDPQRLVEAITDGDEADLGARLVRTYLAIWDDPDSGASMVAMVSSATSNPHANDAFREFMRDYVLTAVSGALGGGPDTRLRAMLAASNLVGTVFLRYIMKVGPIAEVSTDDLVRMIAPTVQRYLTADAEELGLPSL